MNILRDVFWIRADKDSNKKLNIKGHDGKYLQLDTDFNKYENAVQQGEIVFVPSAITKHSKRYNHIQGQYEESGFRNNFKIQEGDKVYFHHFVVDPRGSAIINEEELFQCHYRDIYCVVRDGKIHMIENWVLISPIKETEDDYNKRTGGVMLVTKPILGYFKQTGIVSHINDFAKDFGIQEGNKIYFAEESDYEIKIEGVIYYRMKLSNILFRYADN